MAKSNSGKFYGEKKVKSLWNQICDEFAAERAVLENTDFDDTTSVSTDVTQFSPHRHTPVVYERMIQRTALDSNPLEDFDPSIGHPATIGLSLLAKPSPPPTPPAKDPPDSKTCTPKEYLDNYIFPVLLPGLAEMLKEATKKNCFKRKRFRFNGCDFLTEYLYSHNPNKIEKDPLRSGTSLEEIPFVHRWSIEKPRRSLPLSLLYTEEEAAVKIQAYFRGHLVRIDPEVAELRQWQKDWRIENHGLQEQIQEFWRKHESVLEVIDPPPVLKSVLRMRKSSLVKGVSRTVTLVDDRGVSISSPYF